MNDEIMISVPMARYEELVMMENRIEFLKAYCSREYFTADDIKHYLGIKSEEKADDKD